MAPAKKKAKEKGKAHPGFDKVSEGIAERENIPLKAAKRILAKSTRNASPQAKRANPRLNKVKG